MRDSSNSSRFREFCIGEKIDGINIKNYHKVIIIYNIKQHK